MARSPVHARALPPVLNLLHRRLGFWYQRSVGDDGDNQKNQHCRGFAMHGVCGLERYCLLITVFICYPFIATLFGKQSGLNHEDVTLHLSALSVSDDTVVATTNRLM